MSRRGLRAATLQELLRARALDGDGRGYVFLADGERDEHRLSFAELDRRASAIGDELRRRGLAGSRALLLYPPGLDYICGFFGCLAAPAVAVPVYPPDPARLERSLRRLGAIVERARPSAALTTRAVRSALEAVLSLAPALARLEWIATDEAPAPSGEVSLAAAAPDSVAFLQYTSGSTGAPKGVELTHRNLLHNSARIGSAFGVAPASRGVIWLPPYHDMGLIGGIIQPLHAGIDVLLMSPLAFLERPMRWLEAISRTGATMSGGPNFSYDLCVRKSSPEERAALDLSTWEVAFNGAEPVRAETLTRFAEAFAPAGFRPEAFFPCYGLAESTLIASGGPRGMARVLKVDRQELAAGRAAIASDGEIELVGSGRAFDDGRLVVVDPASGRPRPDGEVGEIWLAGDSVARGYFDGPEETAAGFGAHLAGAEGPFLRTGDLGFVHRGELYVTGRVKDLIIVRGQNHHPTDLERTAERSHAAVRPGCSAAFQLGLDDPRIVLVAELSRARGGASPGDPADVCRAVRQAVAEEHELSLHAVVLVGAGAVPKTSSGKIERHSCRQAYLDGGLPEIARSELTGPDGGELDGREPDGSALRDPARGGEALRRYLAENLARLLGADRRELEAGRPVTASGLDSLMALELQGLLETELGAEVPATWLLRGASLEQIADRVERQLADGAGDRHAPAEPTPTDPDEYPLSPGQRALWFLQLLAPRSAAYNLWIAARVDGSPDPELLRAAFQRLVDRHPALRAAVFMRDGTPWQRVARRAIDFEVIDAAGLSGRGLEDAMAAEAHRPFDLSAGVFRVRLYRCDGDRADALLVAAHHMAIDLWSAGLLLADLAGGEGARAGALSHADHVAGQTAWLGGRDADAALAYWKQKLAGPPPALELPLDAPRPRRQSFRGGDVRFDLDAAVVARLRQLARAEGTTLHALLLSAFAVFLHRLSGQDDLLVGSPTAGRRPGLERTVGYFVNPVVVRADLSGEPSFRQLVRRTWTAALEALEHSAMPFPVLVDRLSAGRSLDRAPLFQALFALERAHVDARLAPFLTGGSARLEVAGAALEPMALEQRASAFDVALVMFEDGGDLRGSWRYDAELFERDTAGRWSRQFAILLSALLADPDRLIGDAPLATEEETRRCLVEWNRTESPPAGEPLFHDLVAQQARRRPGASAAVMSGATLTYAELDRRAGELAWRLRELGVGPERPVAVLLDRSIEWVVAVLGVLKAGGVYLPLDPGLPDERLRFMVADAGAAAAVSAPGLDARLGGMTALHVGAGDAAPRAPLPAADLRSDHAAYIIYTSGSTGRPKGVAVSHRSACNLAEAQRAVFAVTDDCRVSQYASCAFDASFFELSLALTAGAALHLVPARCVLPGPELVHLLQRSAVTTVTLPPTVLEALPAGDLPAIHTVISAGEACGAELASRWAPGRRFYNAYGPTEATVWSTAALLGGGGAPASARRPPIGAPVAGVRAYVLDRQLRPAPVGATGELYLGGVSIARGYVGRPALTAERFVPDSFGPPGGRLYRTGDLARWLDDGAIEFLGRADDQVKIRGYRVEPGEIEAGLRGHPAVRDAAVMARRDRRGEQQLVAYVAADGELALDELRGFLRARGLPDHMMPAAVVRLPALPRTPSGKLDRGALPEPAAPARRGPLAPAAGELEELVLGVFRDVLGHDQIGAHDHFFEVLGGNSLAVVRACALIAERARLDLEVTAIFEHPTVHALAAHLRGAAQARGGGAPAHQARATARAAAIRRRNRPR